MIIPKWFILMASCIIALLSVVGTTIAQGQKIKDDIDSLKTWSDEDKAVHRVFMEKSNDCDRHIASTEVILVEIRNDIKEIKQDIDKIEGG